MHLLVRVFRVSPGRQDFVDLFGDLLARSRAVHSLCQQGIVVGVLVPHRGHHSCGQCALLQCPARLCAPYASASPNGRVFGDGCSVSGRTAGK